MMGTSRRSKSTGTRYNSAVHDRVFYSTQVAYFLLITVFSLRSLEAGHCIEDKQDAFVCTICMYIHVYIYIHMYIILLTARWIGWCFHLAPLIKSPELTLWTNGSMICTTPTSSASDSMQDFMTGNFSELTANLSI